MDSIWDLLVTGRDPLKLNLGAADARGMSNFEAIFALGGALRLTTFGLTVLLAIRFLGALTFLITFFVAFTADFPTLFALTAFFPEDLGFPACFLDFPADLPFCFDLIAIIHILT